MVADGICGCGCGEPTKIGKRGKHYGFKPGHCFRVRQPKGRRVRGGKRVYIAVVERVLGRPLPAGAEVHHIDHDISNNAHGNLVVCQDKSYHRLIERRERALKACGHADWVVCHYCGQYDAPENMAHYHRKGRVHSWRTNHKACAAERQRERNRRLREERRQLPMAA